MITVSRPKKFAFFITIAVLIALVIALPVYFLYNQKEDDNNDMHRGAVVTNGAECAAIGGAILERGGSAVDAAIASLFCEGIAMPQSMGLGGGFLMTIYNKSTNTVRSLNAREIAPAAANETMFKDNSASSTKGGLSVAVPAEMRGYIMAYQYGGKLPWKELVQPAIDLCKTGHTVTEYLAKLLAEQTEQLVADEGLKSVYINPATGKPWVVNDKIKRPMLAKTLEVIAKEPDALHNGSLTENFVKDVVNAGGILTADDLRSYWPQWQDPVRVELPFGQTLYTSPLPGSGVILGFILNIVKDILNFAQTDSVINMQRIVESFKFGYGKRSELGDLNTTEMKDLLANLTSANYAENLRSFIDDNTTNQNATYYGGVAVLPEDHGTAHISVLAPNGDAVSVTSTINLYFGAGFMSQSTGIILNDQMDDFSSPDMENNFGIPPSPNNYISPGKHPLSSMCPSVVLDENDDAKLVIGAAGGTKITTSVAWVLMRHLWFNLPLQDSIYESRFHHQLYPMTLTMEKPLKENTALVKKMTDVGHVIEFVESNGFSAVTAISHKDDIVASGDIRRKGSVVLIK